MKIDPTISNILLDIQENIKVKYKQELSIEEIIAILDIQFFSFILGVGKDMNVKLPNIGKFIHTNKKERRNERVETIKLLDANKQLNPDFNKEEVLKVFIKEWAINTENNKKSGSNKSTKALDVLTRDDAKGETRFNIFKKLGNITKPIDNEF